MRCPPSRRGVLRRPLRTASTIAVRGSQSARAWLAANPAPDLLLLDIQLSDGLSLELFGDGRVQVPTIFVTAYHEFVVEAFQALASRGINIHRRSGGP